MFLCNLFGKLGLAIDRKDRIIVKMFSIFGWFQYYRNLMWLFHVGNETVPIFRRLFLLFIGFPVEYRIFYTNKMRFIAPIMRQKWEKSFIASKERVWNYFWLFTPNFFWRKIILDEKFPSNISKTYFHSLNSSLFHICSTPQ